MTGEKAFLTGLRALAQHSAARGFMDDAAVLDFGGSRLVLTHDMIVEGVHFLPGDPPEDVAWKLVAVNLSDLAAKGAVPVGALLGYALSQEESWNQAFVRGLGSALAAFDMPLLGGDTVSPPADAPRSFGLTAIGRADGGVPSRSDARTGDHLWVSGSIGDAGAGLRVALGQIAGSVALLERYRQPRPRLQAGQRLAPIVHAMMDVSDGLLIDASRIAEASGIAVRINIETIPLSAAYIDALGDGRAARLDAVTAGDDYELLFTAPADRAADILPLADELGLPLSRIGRIGEGRGLSLFDRGDPVEMPGRIGWEHGLR